MDRTRLPWRVNQLPMLTAYVQEKPANYSLFHLPHKPKEFKVCDPQLYLFITRFLSRLARLKRVDLKKLISHAFNQIHTSTFLP